MTTHRSVRASDGDRARVTDMLCDAYAVGCLDRGELEQRSTLAQQARTLGELQDLIADLPGWLLERPAPLPHEAGRRPPARRRQPDQRMRLVLALAGFWLVAMVMAWVPFFGIPLTVVWLVALCASNWLSGPRGR